MKVKRIVIIAVYILLFLALIFLIYLFAKPEATCFDGIQNQAERGVDCGGPCSPCSEVVETKELAIQEVAVVDGGNGTYDAIAKISNPNDSIGAKEFGYTFRLKDVDGNVLASKTGNSFILPADSKFVAELGLFVQGGLIPTSASIELSDIRWENVSDGIGKPQIGVYSKRFGKSPMGEGSEAAGIIRNESNHDIKEVSIVVVLRDENEKIVGVNTTRKDFVHIKEERDFLMTWPYALNATVQKIEVDPQTNIFDSELLR